MDRKVLSDVSDNVELLLNTQARCLTYKGEEVKNESLGNRLAALFRYPAALSIYTAEA